MSQRDSAESPEEELQRLRKRTRELELILDNSCFGICICDVSARILYLNQAFEDLSGLKVAELLGRTMPEVIAAGLADASGTMEVLRQGRVSTVIIHSSAQKEFFCTGYPVYDETGRLFRVVTVFRDVTEMDRLRQQLEESRRLNMDYQAELAALRTAALVNTRLIGRSRIMLQLVDQAQRLAAVDTTVLLLGESGVGKGMMARLIYDCSPRKAKGSFVKVDCGAIPAELLESELFGYETGAFTGARKGGKPGLLELAHKGMLFLDEIGELPPKLQAKLLGVLQDREVTRLGGTRPQFLDLKLIAATNQDLPAMVRDRRFREDLYYRLNVVPLTIPPLRERRADIPPLLVHYTELFQQRYGLNRRLSTETIDVLVAYSWPGNVRELANLVERLLVTVEAGEIGPEYLPPQFVQGYAGRTAPGESGYRSSVEDYEMEVVMGALRSSQTREEAARKLGTSLSTLARRIRKLKDRGYNTG